MKKNLLFSFLAFFVLVLVACSDDAGGEDSGGNGGGNGGGDSSSSGSDEVYELNLSNWAASTHHYGYNVFDPWAELVEERTEGRVKVNVYHGASLGAADSVYQDVSGGLYDVSVAVAQYHYDTGFFPYTIGNLPFAFKGAEQAKDILREFGDKYAAEHLTDVILMPPTSTDGYDLYSTVPIHSVEDLAGLKMRASGNSEVSYANAVGGVPVNMTTGDTYEGLERGMIETAFYSPIGSIGYGFYEPAPYITQLAISVTPVVPIMNKNFFEGLPEDLQTLFEEELNPKFTELLTNSYETELAESHAELKELIEGRGEFITLSDEALEEFREAGQSAWDVWIEDANEKGFDGQQMVDDLFEMIEAAGLPLPY